MDSADIEPTPSNETKQDCHRGIKVEEFTQASSASHERAETDNATTALVEALLDLGKDSEQTFVLVSCDQYREDSANTLREALWDQGSSCLAGRFDRIHEEVEPFRCLLHGFVQSIWQEIDNLKKSRCDDEEIDVILNSVTQFVRENGKNVFESHPDFAVFRDGNAAPEFGDSMEQLFMVLDSMPIARVSNWIPNFLHILRMAKKQPLTILLDDLDFATETSKKMLQSIFSETRVPALFVGFCPEQSLAAVEDFVSCVEINNDWQVIKLSSAGEHFRKFLGVRNDGDLQRETEPSSQVLPDDVQEVMTIAACFGRSVPASLLQGALACQDESLDDEHLAQHGLVRRSHFGEEEFCFSSTLMSSRVYSKIEDKPRMHLNIARRLVEKGILNVDRYCWYLNFVPFHIRHGLRAVLEVERYRLLEVCLEQGGKAVRQTQFSLAWGWLDVGLNLLDRNCWKEEYHLTLSVVSCGVEVAYAKGDHSVVLDLVDRILRNARGLDDTLMAEVMKSYSYDAVGREAEALECCLSTLNNLDEHFCKNPSKVKVALRYKRAKKLIQRSGIESLRTLPPMSEARALSKMQLLAAAVAVAYRPRPVLTALLVIRMVELTMERGACAISAYALCFFGTMVISYGQEIKEGFMCGDVGLALLRRFKAREWVPRVYGLTYAVLVSWNRPLETSLPPLKLSFQAGMCTGDTDSSINISSIYMYFMFVLGRPIKECQEDLGWFLRELKSFRNVGAGFWYKPFQDALDLLSRGFDEKRYEEFMGREWFVEEEFYEGPEKTFDVWTNFVHLMIVTVLGDPRSQQEVAERCKYLLKRPIYGPDLASAYLWDALAAVSVYPTEKFLTRRKLRRLIRFRLRAIKSFTFYSRNFTHGKADLLKAELASLSNSDHHATVLLYEASIALSASANLLLDEGIAAERAGRFLVRSGQDSESVGYFDRAIGAYERYGARAKTEKLSREVSLLCKAGNRVPCA